MGGTLFNIIHECKGCSWAKGIIMYIPSETSNGAVKILYRVFVNLGGNKHAKSIRGKTYSTVIRDDYSR